MPGDFRCTCGDYTRVLSTLHTRLRVHWAPGIPCALCLSRRERFLHLGRSALRERGVIFVIGATPRRGAPVRLRFRFAPATPDTLRRCGLRMAAPRVARKGEAWWGRKDSNLRSHKTADLQSAPFATRDTSPLNSIATHPTKRRRQGQSMTLKPEDPIAGLPVGRVYGGSSTAKSTNGSCQYAPRRAQIAIIRNP